MRCVDDKNDDGSKCPGIQIGRVYPLVDVDPGGKVVINVGGKSRPYLQRRFVEAFNLTEAGSKPAPQRR